MLDSTSTVAAIDAALTRSTDELLAERDKTHGNFSDQACYTQTLKDAFRAFTNITTTDPSWSALSYEKRESLDMIAHKIGRILAGDPDFRDHWDDIAGYAKLVADRCSK